MQDKALNRLGRTDDVVLGERVYQILEKLKHVVRVS